MGELDYDSYMKALGVVKWKGEEPIWRHINEIDRHHKNN